MVRRVVASATVTPNEATPSQIKFDADTAGILAFLQSGTGTVTRTLQDKALDFVSVKDWGAVGDDVADDNTAVTNADADIRAKFLPDGIYKTSLAASALDGPYWGRGQIRDAANHLRAPWFSAIKAAPASLGDTTSVTTAFDGDISKVQIAMEHRITGAATLGTPATGYQADPEASAQFLFLFNSSGHNESLSGNDGRTACSAHRIELANAGQGDCIGMYVNGVVSGTNAGSTQFLSNPAVSMFAGALFGGSDGVFLNPAETQMHDNGHDVAALGWNMIMNRTIGTGAKEAFWGGFRVASQGSQPGDVAFSVVGPVKYGLDLVHGTYTNNAAISLKADQRIYGNAVADGASLSRFPSSAGDDYLTFSSSLNAWNFTVDAVDAFDVYTDRVTSKVNFVVNHTAALAIGPSTTPRIQALATDGNGFGSARYSNGATGTSVFLSKSRGASIGTNTVVQSGDTIGLVRFCGNDGAKFLDAAYIEGRVSTTPGTDDMPGMLLFYTTADGAAAGTERARINHNGFCNVTGGSFGRAAPVTKTADFTVATTENWLINNKSGSACTVTLPSASAFTGREIMFKSIQNQALNSNASNVVPLGGGAAGTAILTTATTGIGKWAILVSDGTNWIIMAGLI